MRTILVLLALAFATGPATAAPVPHVFDTDIGNDVYDVHALGVTRFTAAADGPHRFLTVTKEQAARCREAFAQLASQPPAATPAK